MMHGCLRVPGPPNFGLSTQFLHVPHSSRVQLAHVRHAVLRVEGAWPAAFPAIALPRPSLCVLSPPASAVWTSLLPSGMSERHLRMMHGRLRAPGPPNLGLSRQLVHSPQSARTQFAHCLHAVSLRIVALGVGAFCGEPPTAPSSGDASSIATSTTLSEVPSERGVAQLAPAAAAVPRP